MLSDVFSLFYDQLILGIFITGTDTGIGKTVVAAGLVRLLAGQGQRVPLRPDRFLSDLPEALGLGVIPVVGLRLGFLSHARLLGGPPLAVPPLLAAPTAQAVATLLGNCERLLRLPSAG